MKPQFAQVSGNASPRRSMVPLPIAWSSVIRSSQPCQSSCPQNGHAMRAARLCRKSKMGCFGDIRIATVAHRTIGPVWALCVDTTLVRAIEAEGFGMSRLERTTMPRASMFVRPLIVGAATSPHRV